MIICTAIGLVRKPHPEDSPVEPFRTDPHNGHYWCPEDYQNRDGRFVLREEADLVSTRTPDAEPLLTPAEVASLFRVDPKTVTRWAKAGKLTSIRTLGGHRRYRESEVRDLLAGIPAQRVES